MFLGPTGGTVQDLSPYKNHGTLTSMDVPTDWIPDKYGYALDLDGDNDLINVGQHASLNITQKITLLAVVKHTAAPSDAEFIIAQNLSSPTYNLFIPAADINDYRFRIKDSSTYDATSSDNLVTVGNWTHVVGTYDGTILLLYVNGVQKASTAHTGDIDSSSGVDR